MTNNLKKTHDLVPTPASSRTLTAPEFHQLAQLPPAAESSSNLDNPDTRRAYRNDLQEFMGFVGITSPEEFRLVSRSTSWLGARTSSGASSPAAPYAASSRPSPPCLSISERTSAQYIKASSTSSYQWTWNGIAHNKLNDLIHRNGTLVNNPNTAGSGGGTFSGSGFGPGFGSTFQLTATAFVNSAEALYLTTGKPKQC